MGSTKTKVVSGVEPVVNSTDNSSDEKRQTKTKQRKARVRGQKYKVARAKIDKSKFYSIPEAIKLVRETDIAKFDSTLEAHFTVKKQDLSVNVSLPHSTGVEKTVEIADEKTLEKLENNNIDFDILLATADFMPKLVKYARVLGPRGMMPNPKNGTLVKDKAEAKKFNLSDKLIKTERKSPLIHTVVGKLSMTDKKLKENLEAIIKAISKRQVVKLHLASSMSPSVKVLVE